MQAKALVWMKLVHVLVVMGFIFLGVEGWRQGTEFPVPTILVSLGTFPVAGILEALAL